MIRTIRIDIIDHKQQRYDTLGDWFVEGETLVIKTTATRYPDRVLGILHGLDLPAVAVGLHEAAEAVMCFATGITQKEVDDFDMGEGAELDEPGDYAGAPYAKQHSLATAIERILVDGMGLSWGEYEEFLEDASRA